MDRTIHGTFLPHDDPDASLAFWRDTFSFEVRSYGGMRWITVGPADRPGMSIVPEPPAAGAAGCRLVVPAADFAPRRSS